MLIGYVVSHDASANEEELDTALDLIIRKSLKILETILEIKSRLN